MQERRFEFASEGGPPIAVTLLCREPPETQSCKTLTWQIDPTDRQPRQPTRDGQPGAQQGGGSDGSSGTALPPVKSSAAPDLIGLDIWPASLALCRYLAAHPQLVKGQQVLELGAGMGMAGLLCAALGASSVLLTDYEREVLTQLGRNIQLNGQRQRCSTQLLDFRQPLAGLQPAQHASWRLAVAADVLYAESIAAALVQTLQVLLHAEGIALIGHQVRRAIVMDHATRLPRLEDSDGPLEAFKSGCIEAGLHLRVLSSRPTCSNVDSDPMVLLAVGGGAADLAALPEVP